jgi:hypothetical protein
MTETSPDGVVAAQNVSDAQEIAFDTKPAKVAAIERTIGEGDETQVGLIASAVHDTGPVDCGAPSTPDHAVPLNWLTA